VAGRLAGEREAEGREARLHTLDHRVDRVEPFGPGDRIGVARALRPSGGELRATRGGAGFVPGRYIGVGDRNGVVRGRSFRVSV
jgi:hypothetical protein